MEEFELLCTVLWRVWFRRNVRVHESASVEEGDIVPWAKSYLEEFKRADGLGTDEAKMVMKSVARWQPPTEREFKLNVDAVIDSVRGRVGIGIIIRDAFTPWEANKAAHSLAQIGLTVESDLFWFEDLPPSVADLQL
ncbi:hypothetical protein Dsin_002958 [Dipteronia sinensis]|uniref:RNase H type-1 domain-containing protein n=1 Tax=Dipteronia sinensis TaxID=43782 RepID=A0AAE0B728_9ROSI|nr:hypothetical protein Dsin_002958 [Dipteronia sinensis]